MESPRCTPGSRAQETLSPDALSFRNGKPAEPEAVMPHWDGLRLEGSFYFLRDAPHPGLPKELACPNNASRRSQEPVVHECEVLGAC